MKGFYNDKKLKEMNVLIMEIMMCAEITGDFHLGDFRQPTCKSPLPFDLVS